MIADLPRNRLRKLMGHSFRSSSIESMGVKALLPMRSQRSIPIEPQLSEAARKKIGLLRAPGLDESALTDSDYNVAMADEALRLGALVRDVFLAGECPSFKSLWSACRVWRIGRLNSHSEPKEIQMFGNSRIQELASERQGERFIATRFFSNDPLYGHLSGALTKRIHLFDAGALTRQDARAMAFKDDVLANELGRRVSLQHSFPMDHYFVPLTELRVFVSQKGALLRTVWSHTSNIEYDITKDVLDESESRFLTEGIMKHTRARYLPILAGKVQDYLQAFGALVLDEAMALLNHPLQSIDLQDARVVRLLSSLGEIHYLLAQAAFDERGSAAKSELFIRALSASAGVELPAFKAGFVPDLESFLDTQQNFVQQYLNAFEW